MRKFYISISLLDTHVYEYYFDKFSLSLSRDFLAFLKLDIKKNYISSSQDMSDISLCFFFSSLILPSLHVSTTAHAVASESSREVTAAGRLQHGLSGG